MEIIIDCGDKELAKAIAEKISKDKGIPLYYSIEDRDKFKENTDETVQK